MNNFHRNKIYTYDYPLKFYRPKNILNRHLYYNCHREFWMVLFDVIHSVYDHIHPLYLNN